LPRRLPHAALDRSSLHTLLLALGGLGAGFGRCRLGFALGRRALGAVAAEQPGRGEFAELVAHHVLGDVDGDELVPVVHRERMAHEIGRDGAAPRPGLEHLLLVPLVEGADLHHQRLLDVRTLLYATTHGSAPFPIRNAEFAMRNFAFPLLRFALLRGFPPFTSPYNEFRGAFLLVPRLFALDLAPRIGGGPAARALAFAAAERVIDRVHRYAADPRAAAQPARLARLPDRQQLVLRIPHFADRGEALAAHHAHLRRAQAQRDVIAFFRDDLGAGAGAAAQLPAAADLQLDVVHRRAQRDLEQRHRVPDANVGAGSGDDIVPDAQPFGREDVALLAVTVVQQRDARGPVRVVLDARDPRRNRELVAPEIDAPVLPLVSAALIP